MIIYPTRFTTQIILAGTFLAVTAAVHAAKPAAPEGSPFPEYLQRISGSGGMLEHRSVPLGKAEEASPADQGPLHALRARIVADGTVQGWQTTVTVRQEEDPYVLDYVQLAEPVKSRGLGLVYPLGENFYPVTWEFQSDSGDSACDLLLYDRRQFPKQFDGAYGINTIPKDRINLPAGAPLLRVRILPSGDVKGDFVTWPVIRSTVKGRELVIPFAVGQSELRVLLIPERYRQSLLKTVNNTDFSEAVLRFHKSDDTFQFGTSGALAIKHEPEEGDASILSLGMDYAEPLESTGKLLAFCDFESVGNQATPVGGADVSARIEEARVVDAGVLSGKALYLGQPRQVSKAGLILPAGVRSGLTRDQFTLSAWLKLPWGQLGKNPLVFWPYRRPVEGIKPFTKDWIMGNLGGLEIKGRRWDKNDTIVLQGFGNRLNEVTSLEIGPPGWQHVAIAVNGNQAKVYLNGHIRSVVTLPGPVTAEELQKGGEIELLKNYWGMLDKVRLHDFSLSEKQVRALMKSDIPDTLLRYPLDTVTDGFTPSIPSGEFPVDAWSWQTHDFKPEVSFAAEAKGAKVVEGPKGPALQVGAEGILIPPKATLDFGLDRIAVGFWFRPDAAGGMLLTSRGHPKYGFQIKYSQNGLGGIVCNAWNLPAADVRIAPGEWHHFAFCYDNYEMRMYLDGKLIKKANYIPELPLNLVDGLGIAQGMKGAVTDIRVFGRMLSEKDASALFQKGAGGE